MALTNPYCTVEELREHLKDAGTKLDQALLERAINATSRAVERFTGRRFWLDDTPTVRRYRPVDGELVWIHDIGDTTGIVVETRWGDGWETWDAGDYELEPLDADAYGGAYAWTCISAVGDRRFPVGERRPSLRITARHGWSAIPDDVNAAALLKAAALFRRKDAPFGVAGVGEFGPLRITRKDPDVIELLNNFLRAKLPET